MSSATHRCALSLETRRRRALKRRSAD
jgi:hypothetical protein